MSVVSARSSCAQRARGLLALLCVPLAGAALWSAPAWSATMTFTDPALFSAALPGPAQVLDFDALAPGTLLPSGSTQGGVTFTYSIAGLTMEVVDTFSTTSGTNSLGLTGGDDAFLDGDTFDLAFSSSVLALGMFFITSDAALASEILVVTPIGTAGNSATPFGVLPDGGIAYFVGLIGTGLFSTAQVDFAADGETNFAFNVDDIATAVPEPWTALLVGFGAVSLGVLRRHQLLHTLPSVSPPTGGPTA